MRKFMRHPVFRVVAFVVGVALVGCAVWFAVREVKWNELAAASPYEVGCVVGLVFVTLMLTGVLFWQVNLSFDAVPRVPLLHMTELIAASSLLNYLPLKPGLVGRAAYLKAQFGMPIHQSLMVVGIVTVLSVVATLIAATVGIQSDGARWYVGLGLVVVASVATPWIGRSVLRRPVVHAWVWVPLRCLELLVSAGRLWLTFRIVGSEVEYWQATIMAASGFLVMLVGITPNGLGVKEWVVALLAPAISPAAAASAGLAAVLDRAAEVIVLVLCGVVSLLHIGPGLRPRKDEVVDDLPPAQV